MRCARPLEGWNGGEIYGSFHKYYGKTQMNFLVNPIYNVCHILLFLGAAAAGAKLLQLCPTLCDPIDGSPPLPSAVPRWRSGKKSACKCRTRRFDSWIRKTPWRGKWQFALVFLPGKFHGQRRLAGYSPWGYKELDTTEHTRNILYMYA